MTRRARTTAIRALLAGALLPCLATPAAGQDVGALAEQIGALRHSLEVQRATIESAMKRLDQQQHDLDQLQQQAGAQARGQRPAAIPPAPIAAAEPPAPLPPFPPGPSTMTIEAAAVSQPVAGAPDEGGVLTRAGQLIIEPSIEYSNSSSSRLVFRGIELIPGVQIGSIEASDADRDTLAGTMTVRYGVARSLEVEASVPYLVRSDRVVAIQQRNDTASQTSRLAARGLGDVEFGLRYQINRQAGDRPILIGSLRVKTDTGRGPFSVPYDAAGVATGLATGSGFWAVQPGLSFLVPSDPVVIYGGLTYLHQFARTVDATIGDVVIGRVRPGDSIGGAIGFGFALNPRFSFSIGYRHNYVFPMRWEIDGTPDSSYRLQVGSLTLGMAYRLNERQALNLGIEVGATKDAPNVSVVLRTPFSSR